MFTKILENWRTSGLGVILFGISMVRIFWPNMPEIDANAIFQVTIAIAGAVGLFVAKDAHN